jgi:hypothetical protein
VHKSLDGFLYYPVISIVSPAIMGYAQNALGNFTGGNIVDELNALTVDVGDSTLSSCTYLEMLNGANPFALYASDRWEVGQFRTATLNGDGTYTLTGLLRGRKGSESAISHHVFGDRFVMLTQGIYKAGEPLSDMRVERFWKGVSFGLVAADIAGTAFTDSGASLKPLSPVNLGGGRAANDLTITWVRRTRIGQEWLNVSGDVPLGELYEKYDVEIYADGTYATVKRTFAGVGVRNVVYTSAMQVADFGSNQATVYFKVYQMSDLVGRGFPGIGAV